MESFQLLLDPRELTASYRAEPAVADYVFTNTFYTNVQDKISDTGRFLFHGAISKPAPGNNRGAEARNLTPTGATERHYTLFHVFNYYDLRAEALNALRREASFELQEKGEEIVAEVINESTIRHRLHKEVALALFLQYGRINMNADGELLVPTESANGALTDATNTVVSADFTMPNANRGELSGIITRSWTNSDARISDDLEEIRYTSARNFRVPPTEIYINTKNKRWLRDNTQFKDWAKESTRAVESVLRGDIIEDLWGFNWHFVDGAWTDVNGTVHDLVHLNKAIICPKPGAWMKNFRGSELVPGSLEIQTSPEAALANLNRVYGEFAYATLAHNPARLQMYTGDNYGFAFADPNVVYAPSVFASTETSGTS